ncbi:MAG: hypothetical protein HC804_00155 [Anaerolineae bacterium]|nr:hypothetical protein [Anaerolineae bacterium]
MIKRVQVFTPIYRLEPETVQAVLALQWDGPISWVFQRDNPLPVVDRESGRLNILHQYQQARDRFLSGNDDALLVIESDIVPPADALRKLAALDADVAYGVYRFRVSNVINIFERYPGEPPPRNEGQSLSLHRRKLARAVRVGSVPCTGGGLGCALIKRHVLEAIPFRLENTAHCDSYFNRDVLHHGFEQMAEMTVICGHKAEDGRMLWPELT